MNKSESISKLAQALVQVQKTELFALTDKENPFFKSRYADLSSVWSAIRKPLTDNGLSIVQTMDIADKESVIIETTLLHASGEYISGRLLITPEKFNPQGVGSAITYGRRYALSAIIGISPEDDDGEGSMHRKKQSTPPSNTPAGDKSKDKTYELSTKQWNFIKSIGEKKELSGAEVINLVKWVAEQNNIEPKSYKIAKIMLPEDNFQVQLDKYLDSIDIGEPF